MIKEHNQLFGSSTRARQRRKMPRRRRRRGQGQAEAEEVTRRTIKVNISREAGESDHLDRRIQQRQDDGERVVDTNVRVDDELSPSRGGHGNE